MSLRPDTSDPRYWDALAPEYAEYVITPFDRRVPFDLGARLDEHLQALEREGEARRRTVLDLGVGTGESLLAHAGRVGLSVGLDFSPGMLEHSAARLREAGVEVERAPARVGLAAIAKRCRAVNRRRPGAPPAGEGDTLLTRGDMRRLDALHGRGDLVLAINSLTAASDEDSQRMFAEAGACVRRGGQLWAALPSRDTMDHLEALITRSGRPRPEGLGHFEEPGGVYVDVEGGRQKFWRPGEIEAGVREAGLRVHTLEPIPYPWRVIAESGWGHFPRARRLWDWFLIAERR